MIDAPEEEAMEVQLGTEEWMVAQKASFVDELDPCIIDDKPQTALMEELENFKVGSHVFLGTCWQARKFPHS